MSSTENNNSQWVKRNITDEPRLSELVEMYKSLGFDVMIKDFKPEELSEDCSDCMAAYPERYKVIFTRKKAS